MIRDLIRRQFLGGNTTEHDALKSICEAHEWNPDDEDLYQLFKVEYDAVIQSDWWERVQREQRMAEFVDEQIEQTDLQDYQTEKLKIARKYG